MQKPIISMIAAIGEKRVLGKENKLLWNIPEDLKRFRTITAGHCVIMGRKTYESIGKPLPNRTNIIVTRDINYQAPNCLVVHSIEKALEIAREKEVEEIFVIGGGQIYAQALPYADKLYLTIVKGNFSGDAFFPDYSEFKKVINQEEKSDGNFTYTFLELTKE